MIRVRRRFVDRLLDSITPVRRFRCASIRCGYVGNRPRTVVTRGHAWLALVLFLAMMVLGAPTLLRDLRALFDNEAADTSSLHASTLAEQPREALSLDWPAPTADFDWIGPVRIATGPPFIAEFKGRPRDGQAPLSWPLFSPDQHASMSDVVRQNTPDAYEAVAPSFQ